MSDYTEITDPTEVLRKGDEFLDATGKWCPLTVGFGWEKHRLNNRARRPIPQPEESTQVKFLGMHPIDIRVEEEPLMRSILQSDFEKIHEALHIGLENTQELLANHDIQLGRTTRSNRATAERLEGEIRQIQEAIELIEP